MTSGIYTRTKEMKVIKYPINETFFKKWNIDMAYILGFIYADGSISERTYKGYKSIRFDLEIKDKNHLLNIRKIIMSKAKVRSMPKGTYQITTSNVRFIKGLQEKGVLFRKTYYMRFPKIPKQYISHFIRGYFDGDGWTTLSLKNNSIIAVQAGFACGCEMFLKDLQKILKVYDINLKIYKRKPTLFFGIITDKKSLINMYSLFYKTNIFCLERKFVKFNRMIGRWIN